MKAKKIDLSGYSTGQRDEKGEPVTYDVRKSLVNVLFHPGLQLDPFQVLEANELADKIRIGGDEILLSQSEYAKVLAGLKVVKGCQEADVEFVRRLINAEEVELQEAEA